MQLIPVLDLAAGIAVHARGGDRATYRPVESVLIPDDPGSALALARAYRERLGARLCYVADLDAILGRRPQLALVQRLADPARGFGAGLLVDSGITQLSRAREVLSAGASAVAIGLETLVSFDHLAGIVEGLGADRVVFSLDLWDGVALRRPKSPTPETPDTIRELASRAAESGAERILILDLARVGQGSGVDLDPIRELKRIHSGVSLLAGGGIRGPEDLVQLRAAGCDGVLVGTAIHEGRITAADFELQAADEGSRGDCR